MKPIYFPFTYVPQWVAETLAVCFKHFIVYQPSGKKLPDEMQPWVEANVMEVCVPVLTEDEKLAEVVKDFRSFASLHEDSKNLRTAAFLGQQYAIPFFGESAASQIISDIKKSSQSESAVANFDPLFYARVFLDFAQEFDRQSDELNQGLGVNNQRSHDLLKKLSGEKESGLPVTPLTAEIKVDDPGEYMALGRLQAWIQLFMEDPVDSGLLVTSSPSAFNYLIENLPVTEKIIQFKRLPSMAAKDDTPITWPDLFLKQIKQLIEAEPSTTEDAFADMPLAKNDSTDITLTLYLVPGQSAADLLTQVLEAQKDHPIKLNQRVGIKNTLIGLIGH